MTRNSSRKRSSAAVLFHRRKSRPVLGRFHVASHFSLAFVRILLRNFSLFASLVQRDANRGKNFPRRVRISASFRALAIFPSLSSSCQRDSISRESRFTLSFKNIQIVRLTSRKCAENISKFPTLSRAPLCITNRLKYTTQKYFCIFYDTVHGLDFLRTSLPR